MAERKTSRLAWALFGMVALSGAGSYLPSLLQPAPAISPIRFVSDLIFSLGTPLLFAGVGALILSRLPGHRIGWLLMTPALAIGVFGPLDAYLQPLAASPPAPTPLLLLLVWLAGWSWLWLVFPLLLIAQLFPGGRALSPRWRLLARATLGWAALFVTLVTLSDTYSTIDATPVLMLANPFGIIRVQWLDELVGAAWIPGLLLLTGLSAAALVLRYRRAGLVEREQIAWLLYACALFAVVYIGGGVLGVAGESTPAGDVYNLLFSLTVLAFPAAIGAAILRYRLFDIDIIVRRTLVYAALTLALGAVYLGSVVALQALFVRLTGQESTLAVVASTLGIAALFGPLRARVQRFIDRRFFRRRYDAVQVMDDFARRAQREAELDMLAADVLGVVQGTLEPERARLWLVRPQAAGSESARGVDG